MTPACRRCGVRPAVIERFVLLGELSEVRLCTECRELAAAENKAAVGRGAGKPADPVV